MIKQLKEIREGKTGLNFLQGGAGSANAQGTQAKMYPGKPRRKVVKEPLHCAASFLPRQEGEGRERREAFGERNHTPKVK